MNRSRIPYLACCIVYCALVVLLAASALAKQTIASADEQRPFQTYIPVVAIQRPSIFGMNVTRLSADRGIDDLTTIGTKWVRGSSLRWRDIEPTEGADYNWNAPSVLAIEQEMINASQHNLNFIVIVHNSPRWAVKPFASDCAPINPSKYKRFAAFMAAAAERYSKAPYNVTFWEIGNEPDAYIFPYDSGYGCWGSRSDTYYGGRAYGEMLNVVYPAIKAVAPQVNVLNGGLLLGQPYNPADGTGASARFLEGVFLAGGGASFDILSFHSYSYYNGSVNGTRGPTDWKVEYLRNIMRTYNVPEKPMIDTEAALLCAELTEACRKAQADAIGRYYIRAINDRLIGHLWYIYDSDSFNNTALVEPRDVSLRRQTYLAYQQVSMLVGDASFLGPLEHAIVNVEGYRFAKKGQIITAFWSDIPQLITLLVAPNATISCFDRDGQPVTCTNTNGQVAITAQIGPTYVVEDATNH